MESGRTAGGGAYKSWELFTRISFIRLLFPSLLSLISLPHNWNDGGGGEGTSSSLKPQVTWGPKGREEGGQKRRSSFYSFDWISSPRSTGWRLGVG